MKYDIPGRRKATKLIRYRDGREYVFDLPVVTEDPIEIEILSADPLVRAIAEPAAIEPPAPEEEPKGPKFFKPSRKKV